MNKIVLLFPSACILRRILSWSVRYPESDQKVVLFFFMAALLGVFGFAIEQMDRMKGEKW